MSARIGKTHVIILAQGEQRRLPDLKVPKQLLTLKHEGKAFPILYRTIRQLWQLVDTLGYGYTVVCKGDLATYLTHDDTGITGAHVLTLNDPGNSSLKGIARCLTVNAYAPERLLVLSHRLPDVPDRVVVLLGDVVYSWDVLQWMVRSGGDHGFAISTDLSAGGGEVWGLWWDVDHGSAPMRAALVRALEKHPPFAEYQPGQMRNWLYEVMPEIKGNEPNGGACTRGMCVVQAFDDYTMDVDTPKDIPLLDKVAPLAHADDLAHGVTW